MNSEHKYPKDSVLRDCKTGKVCRISGHYDNANPQADPTPVYEVVLEDGREEPRTERELEPYLTVEQITTHGYAIVEGHTIGKTGKEAKMWFFVNRETSEVVQHYCAHSFESAVQSCRIDGDGNIWMDKRTWSE